MLWVVALSWGMERGRLKSGDGWQGFLWPQCLASLGLILQGMEKLCYFACQVLSASGVRFGGSGNWVREYPMTTGTKYRTIILGIELDAWAVVQLPGGCFDDDFGEA